MMEETWKEHPMYKGYEGSTLGKVRSWRRSFWGRVFYRKEPFIMSLCPASETVPYFRIILSFKSKPITVIVHRFIAECFLPNPDNKKQVNHKNGIKTDNRVGNLEWVTCSENHFHAYATGLRTKKGEHHHLNKLTDADVLKIREDYSTGKVSQVELAQQYGVTYSSIGMVVSGKRWSHIKGADSKDHRAGRKCLKKRKLTDMQVVEIKEALKNGVSQRKLGRMYGISQTPIYEIAHGKRYKEIL